MKQWRCPSAGRCREPSCTYMHYFAPLTNSVSHRHSICECSIMNYHMLICHEMTKWPVLWCRIKFCLKLGNAHVETNEKIQQAIGAISITQNQECYYHFKNGCILVECGPHSSRPTLSWIDEIIDHVQTVVMLNHQVSICEVADNIRINIRSVHSFFSERGMREAFSKFMLKLPTMKHKQLWKSHGIKLAGLHKVWPRFPEHHDHWWWFAFTGMAQKPKCSHHRGDIHHPQWQSVQ